MKRDHANAVQLPSPVVPGEDALARLEAWFVANGWQAFDFQREVWRAYLDGSARAVPADDATKAYVENAQVYYKQALASPGAPKGTSRQ